MESTRHLNVKKRKKIKPTEYTYNINSLVVDLNAMKVNSRNFIMLMNLTLKKMEQYLNDKLATYLRTTQNIPIWMVLRCDVIR